MANAKKTKRPNANLLRAWFDTVLNPIYTGLANAKKLLDENNYSWDWGCQDTIEIKNIIEYFDFRYTANWEQIVLTEFPELLDLTIEYMGKRAELSQSCKELFDKLTNSDILQNLISTNVNEYEKLGLISAENAEYIRTTKSINWIAEHLINNIRAVPYSHILKNVWNRPDNNFFSIFENKEIQVFKADLDDKAKILKEVNDRTLKYVKDKMNDLSMEFGVPLVI